MLLFTGNLNGNSSKDLPGINWALYDEVVSRDYATIEDLADYVDANFTSDRDKAAAIFFWIANNIAYDTDLIQSVVNRDTRKRYTQASINKLYENRINYAWEKRRGVCDNYARLYQRLATLCNVKTEIVSGHARGDYLEAGKLGVGHAWNAVLIDGEWELLDVTWGSGHVSRSLEFERVFKPQYFFPDPATLAYSHHPKDDKWQLLKEPVSQTAYLGRPAVGEAFLQYDLRQINYDLYNIVLPDGSDFTLGGTGENLPSEFVCANLTTGIQIPCQTIIEGDEFRITVPESVLEKMKLGILSPEGEVVLGYQVKITR